MEISSIVSSLSSSSPKSSSMILTANRYRFIHIIVFIWLIAGNLFDVTDARAWNTNTAAGVTVSSNNINNNNNQADVADQSQSSSSLSGDNNNNLSQEELLYSIRPAAAAAASSGASALTNSGSIGGGGGGGTDETIRNYRSSIDTIRLMSPYVLHNYLASRLQSSDYLGKRMGSEFLGKKRSIIAAIRRPSFSSSYYLDNNHLLSGQQQPSQQQRQQQQQQLLSAPQLSILASPYFMAQKKMGSEFLGR
ncbi:uncharacterized protein LOC124493880 [Dermatophagoides farinae]|uniref:uncharacterized protein LOC124493880 n=1 Tax=Dermatophagoides farinae TaxID=6954 RepID=UPI003F635C11